jgi:hypothetical protein
MTIVLRIGGRSFLVEGCGVELVDVNYVVVSLDRFYVVDDDWVTQNEKIFLRWK